MDKKETAIETSLNGAGIIMLSTGSAMVLADYRNLYGYALMGAGLALEAYRFLRQPDVQAQIQELLKSFGKEQAGGV